jgi:hypothetical protein
VGVPIPNAMGWEENNIFKNTFPQRPLSYVFAQFSHIRVQEGSTQLLLLENASETEKI